MKERKPGLFGSLFQRKKKGPEVDLSLPGILAMAVGKALSAASGQSVSCSVETLEWDGFRGESASIRSGYVLNSFGASEQYGVCLVFPEAFVSRWTRALAATDPGLDKARLVPQLIAGVAGDLPRLVRLNVDSDDGRAAVQPLSSFPKKCLARDVEELLWRAAGCRIFRLSPISGDLADETAGADAQDALLDGSAEEADAAPGAGSPAAPGEGSPAAPGEAVYVLIETEDAERLAASLDGDDVFRAVAGRLMGAEEAEDAEEARIETAPTPRGIAVRSPLEFVLGNFLLLPKVPCGKYVGEARFHELFANADPRTYATAPGTWVRLSCALALPTAPGAAPQPPRSWVTYLFFQASDAARAAQAQNMCRQVASCFFQAELGFLKGVLGAAPSQPVVGMGVKPDFAASKGQAVFKGRVGVAGTRMPVDAFLDYGTLSWLLRLFCDPWDAQNAPKGAEAVLSLLLSLNQSLLRRWLPSFHRRFLDVEPAAEPGAPPRERLPFPVFLDLLGDRDARILLQNQVLRSLGDRDIRSLYRCAVRVKDAEGNEAVRIVTPRAFDEERLKNFLPRRAMEDWQIASPDRLASPSENQDLSDAVLKGIREALQRKQILVSPKVSLILEKMFVPGARGASKRKMEQAASSKEPFESLHKMPRPTLQQFLGVQSNKALCLVLVGAEAELPLIRENISKNKCRTLDEDLEIQKRLLESDELDADEVIEAKLSMGRGAQETLEELEKSRKASAPVQTRKSRGWSVDKPPRGADVEEDEKPEAEEPRPARPVKPGTAPGAPRGTAPGAPRGAATPARPGIPPANRPTGLGSAASAQRLQKPGTASGSAPRPPQGPPRGTPPRPGNPPQRPR